MLKYIFKKALAKNFSTFIVSNPIFFKVITFFLALNSMPNLFKDFWMYSSEENHMRRTWNLNLNWRHDLFKFNFQLSEGVKLIED
jgi:hypothetical protein